MVRYARNHYQISISIDNSLKKKGSRRLRFLDKER